MKLGKNAFPSLIAYELIVNVVASISFTSVALARPFTTSAVVTTNFTSTFTNIA